MFFVGVEANGQIYAYALNLTGSTFTKVATIDSGFPSVMDLEFDRDLNDLWAICDNGCDGRSSVLRIGANGKFSVAGRFERPIGLPNVNNEGFTIAPATQCAAGVKPVFWSDDDETGGQSLHSGTLNCAAF